MKNKFKEEPKWVNDYNTHPPVPPKKKLFDMNGKKCLSCKKGIYKETSLHDDLQGVLHCDKCGYETKRWIDSLAGLFEIFEVPKLEKKKVEIIDWMEHGFLGYKNK